VDTYITTTLPYVNGRPHLGHALEYVEADVLARHRRARGDQVRFQAGTDDNSLKNVLAAHACGQGVQEFVDQNTRLFLSLVPALSLTVDDVIRTSTDPRHRPGVTALWRACAGDLYRQQYQGLYCTGCEQFYKPQELDGGRCAEHPGTPVEEVEEENWFFRLSRYEDQLRDAIRSGRLRIEPAGRRNEVLALIESGLDDFSVSRPASRAQGWGIPVPGDPGQVIYVWFDALANYVTALGYGSAAASEYQRWWGGDGRRVQVLGKGVLRFHAVYWPAMLASAGLPLPTDLFVHDYLTASGGKISKSAQQSAQQGGQLEPAALAASYGTDALRWWLLREVPRVGDTDFTPERLIARADNELANGIGNLVNRVVAMIHRYRGGLLPGPAASAASPGAGPVASAIASPIASPIAGTDELTRTYLTAPERVDAALADFSFRSASGAVWQIAHQANGYINQVKPWTLAGAPGPAAQLDTVLGTLYQACQVLAAELTPFLPDAAVRIAAQLTPVSPGGPLPRPAPVFSRLRVQPD
jgi:methionyl-tRNA synthetase